MVAFQGIPPQMTTMDPVWMVWFCFKGSPLSFWGTSAQGVCGLAGTILPVPCSSKGERGVGLKLQ